MLGELEGVHVGRHDRGANHSRHRPGSNLATNGLRGSGHRASFVCQHKQVNTGGHQTSPQVRSGMVDKALGQVPQGQGNRTCRNAEDRSGNGTLGLILAGCDSSIEFAGTNRPESKNETGHTKPSTLGWLAGSIFRIDSVHEIDPKSQSTRRAIIEDCLREPPEPESTLALASCPLKEITPAIVMMLMDRKVKDGKRGAANNRKNTYQRCSVGRPKIAT